MHKMLTMRGTLQQICVGSSSPPGAGGLAQVLAGCGVHGIAGILMVYIGSYMFCISFAHVDRRFASIVFVLEFEFCCYCIYIMLIVKNGAITKGISTALVMSVIGDIKTIETVSKPIESMSKPI